MSIDLDLDFRADLRAGFGELAQQHRDGTRKIIDTLRAQEPADVRFQVAGSVASGDVALNLGGPDPGFYWMVRRIIVGGLQWTTSAAGTAEVYVTALGGNTSTSSGSTGSGGYAGIRNLSDLVDQSASLPSKAFYGLHELPLNSGENLIVVIHSPSASQQYVASVQVQVFRHITERSAFQS